LHVVARTLTRFTPATALPGTDLGHRATDNTMALVRNQGHAGAPTPQSIRAAA